MALKNGDCAFALLSRKTQLEKNIDSYQSAQKPWFPGKQVFREGESRFKG